MYSVHSIVNDGKCIDFGGKKSRNVLKGLNPSKMCFPHPISAAKCPHSYFRSSNFGQNVPGRDVSSFSDLSKQGLQTFDLVAGRR